LRRRRALRGKLMFERSYSSLEAADESADAGGLDQCYDGNDRNGQRHNDQHAERIKHRSHAARYLDESNLDWRL
jgi:hypothetical protein